MDDQLSWTVGDEASSLLTTNFHGLSVMKPVTY